MPAYLLNRSANVAELLVDIVFIALGVVIFAAFGLYAAYLRTI